MNLLTVFIEFFKTGLFAVGGGLATLPFLYNLSDKYGWYTYGDLADMIAISESTPGPIGVNMATFAGFRVGEFFGALAATVGLVMPSVIIVLIVARVLEKFNNSPYVNHAFYGLRPAVVGLIAAAGFEIFKIRIINIESLLSLNFLGMINLKPAVVFAIFLALMLKLKKLHPIVFIIIGAVSGIVLGGI